MTQRQHESLQSVRGQHVPMICPVLSRINRIRIRKKSRQQEMSVVMSSCLMDITFDLYVFHFLE